MLLNVGRGAEAVSGKAILINSHLELKKAGRGAAAS